MNFLKPKFWDENKISIFSILLYPISIVFLLINILRKNLIKKNSVSIPAICVGNIYLGGTGKTPTCIEIFSIIKALGKRTAFIRKKYKSFEDEINLLKKIGPVYEDKKRINALNLAIKDKVEVAILDDGYQDYSVIKRLSIICFGAKQGIGNGHVIPSGPLRENLNGLKRSDIVLINGSKNSDLEKIILNKNKKIKIFYSTYLLNNKDEIKNKKVVCFAGVGNPDNVFDLLEKNDIQVIEKFFFPDHHIYSDTELKNLINTANEKSALLITTEKDFLRIKEEYKKYIQYLKVSLEIKDKEEFINEIKKVI